MSSSHGHNGSQWSPHVVSAGTLIGVFVTLLALTAVTVAVAQVELGEMNVVVALAVACVKATVVALFFMHLKYDQRFNLVVLIGSLFFAVFFVAFCLLDTTQYQPDVRAKVEASRPANTR